MQPEMTEVRRPLLISTVQLVPATEDYRVQRCVLNGPHFSLQKASGTRPPLGFLKAKSRSSARCELRSGNWMGLENREIALPTEWQPRQAKRTSSLGIVGDKGC